MSDSGDSREAILAAAKILFVEQGYRGISMRQIAEAVGVTKAALYYHFQDKEDLFVAIVAEYLAEMSQIIDAALASQPDVRAQITDLVHTILVQPPEQRSILRLVSQEMSNVSPAHRAEFMQLYHEQFIGRIMSMLQTGMARGELRTLDPGLATWTLLGMMYPYFHPASPSGPPAGEQQIKDLLSIFFEGLGQPQR